jgi:hypothetical protein
MRTKRKATQQAGSLKRKREEVQDEDSIGGETLDSGEQDTAVTLDDSVQVRCAWRCAC